MAWRVVCTPGGRSVSLGNAHTLAPNADGLDGEIVAIGSGIQSLSTVSFQQIRRERSMLSTELEASGGSQQLSEAEVFEEDTVPVGVEQPC